MPNWRKVVVSGSDAKLNSVYASDTISAYNGFEGNLIGTASWSINSIESYIAENANRTDQADHLYIQDSENNADRCPILFTLEDTSADYKDVYEDSSIYINSIDDTIHARAFIGDFEGNINIELTNGSNSLKSGEVCCISTEGTTELASVFAGSKALPAVVMCISSLNPGEKGRFLVSGKARNKNWNWEPGNVLYTLDKGEITQDPPDPVQAVGVALTNDTILFRPDFTIVKRDVLAI